LQIIDYTKESTCDLLEFLSWKDEEEYQEVAEKSFVEICYRFRKNVVQKCEIVAKNNGLNAVDAEQIAENVFKKIWKYGGKFDCSRHKDVDAGFRGYLFRIAQRETVNYYCFKKGIGVSPYTGEEKIIEEFPEINEQTVPNKLRRAQLLREKEIIDLALERHTWKHKVIYLTYKFYQIDDHKLPRPLLKDLREMLGLPQATIQAYKKEITDTIDHYLRIYGKAEK